MLQLLCYFITIAEILEVKIKLVAFTIVDPFDRSVWQIGRLGLRPPVRPDPSRCRRNLNDQLGSTFTWRSTLDWKMFGAAHPDAAQMQKWWVSEIGVPTDHPFLDGIFH